MGAVTWTAPTSASIGIASQTINSGAGYLGSEYDNETNLYRWGVFTLDYTMGTTAAVGGWLVYLVLDVTSADYEDGDASTQPEKAPVVVFNVTGDTSAHDISSEPVLLPPFAFKALLWNDTDQNSAATACTLTLEVFNETVA